MAGVVLAGVGGAWLVEQRNEEEVRTERAVVARQARGALTSMAGTALAALSGANGITSDDGTVDQQSLDAFGAGVFAQSTLVALAYEPVVTNDQRATFEARTGRPITDRGDDGLSPAPTRDEYFPVERVAPVTTETTSLFGFDIGGDPVRGTAARQARDDGATVFSAPVESQPTRRIGFAVVTPLYRPGAPVDTVEQRQAAITGFVTTAIVGVELLDDVSDALPAGTRLRLSDNGTVIAETEDRPGRDAVTATVEIGGRRWTLEVETEPSDAGRMSWFVLVADLLLAGALAALFAGSSRHQRAVEDAARAVAETAELAALLVAATTTTEVATIVADEVPRLLGATSANLGVPDATASALVLRHDDRIDAVLAERYSVQAITTSTPHIDAWTTGREVLVADLESYRARYPALANDVAAAGLHSVAAVPLRSSAADVLGVIGLAWARPMRFDEPTMDLVHTVADLCAQSLERAGLTDGRTRAATTMSTLARHLSAARTFDDVTRTIARHGPAAADADWASVGFVDHGQRILRFDHLGNRSTEGVGRPQSVSLDADLPAVDAVTSDARVLLADIEDMAARYPDMVDEAVALGLASVAALPLGSSDGQVAGVVLLGWHSPRSFDEEIDARLQTIAELCEQTVDRARLYDTEHRLVIGLQERLLTPMPEVSGLEVAVRYVPSTSEVGMGGDWYEGITTEDGSLALVVGDVAGHGIAAVTDMAQLRTMLSALLQAGFPPPDVLVRASELVGGTTSFVATVLVSVFDVERDELALVSAGHPPPLLQSPDGTIEVVEEARVPLLGLPVPRQAPAVRPFAPGAVFVAYTDGLVERSGEMLDVGIARVATALGEIGPTSSLEAVADDLLVAGLAGREPTDDVALVVVRRV